MKTSPHLSIHDRSNAAGSWDWNLIQERAAQRSPAEMWRSLEELAKPPDTESLLNEFPPGASEMLEMNRRHFLKLMSGALALAGVNGCTRQPIESIVPYVRQPEAVVPGESLFYATAVPFNGYAHGLIVRSREGRPVKVEGNPDHPINRGATSIFDQASLLQLYDPDRAKAITFKGQIRSWNTFLAALNDALRLQQPKQGAGLRILTEHVTSPALHAQIQSLLKQYPQARWHQYQPISLWNIYEGARLVFGSFAAPQYSLSKANVIVSLGADFLHAHPAALAYAADYAQRRREMLSGGRPLRFYMAESHLTVTGSVADQRWPIRPSEMAWLTHQIARELGINIAGDATGPPNPELMEWIKAMVRDIKAHPNQTILLAGEWCPPELHGLVFQINQALGNWGSTMWMTAPADASPVNPFQSLGELTHDLNAGQVESLLILGANPVHTAPADIPFREALAKVPFTAHLSRYYEETSLRCHWHIPEHHPFEEWGDLRSYDGTVSLIQPLILPLYQTKSALELLEVCLDFQSTRSGYDVVREYWKRSGIGDDFELNWEKSLHDGKIPYTTLTRLEMGNLKPVTGMVPSAASPAADSSSLEIEFRPDPTLWDGRFANNAWLQELPKPITKLTWGNAAFISPDQAQLLNLSPGAQIQISVTGQSMELPVMVLPGQAKGVMTVYLGHGREHAGSIGSRIGHNAYTLRTSGHPGWITGQIKPLGRTESLATTQNHYQLRGRNIFRSATLREFLANPQFAHLEASHGPNPTLYHPEQFENDLPAWGMVIDLTTCIGCSACVLACQSENNIPVVGKDQVLRGREMHWIRVDTYFHGDLQNPQVGHEPVPCMHCETAPCEVVCPVAATVHDREGLNLQVYNRCIGTRYCSNNCPYKVRRFNFLQYSDQKTPAIQLMRNPEVTVRTRGVMEKCTYCVQRIAAARIAASKDNRPIRDGEVRTACQQACPTEAIVFGNIKDPQSKVRQLKNSPLNYAMLGELNTQPRTTYLAQVRNPSAKEAS